VNQSVTHPASNAEVQPLPLASPPNLDSALDSASLAPAARLQPGIEGQDTLHTLHQGDRPRPTAPESPHKPSTPLKEVNAPLPTAGAAGSAPHPQSASPPSPDPVPSLNLPYSATIDLAARDVRLVLQEQREQSQILITKLNILFVATGALLTSLTISRLMAELSPFSIAEALEFIVSFALLVRAFLPRQVAVSPNLEDRKFLERYLALSAEQYQLQMLVNLAETYNANKQRLDDISQTLIYAAYATLSIAITMLLHMVFVYSGWAMPA
jgi:hypothetical protein